FDTLLSRNKHLLGEIKLILIVAPSRTALPEHVALADDIQRLVENVNAKYRTGWWAPIHYIYSAIPQEELVAYYAIADVAVVTPIADGMNLVAKEYIFVRHCQGGALVLSNTAGSAAELGHAYLVNPKNQTEIVDAMLMAIGSAPAANLERTTPMVERLT